MHSLHDSRAKNLPCGPYVVAIRSSRYKLVGDCVAVR